MRLFKAGRPGLAVSKPDSFKLNLLMLAFLSEAKRDESGSLILYGENASNIGSFNSGISTFLR